MPNRGVLVFISTILIVIVAYASVSEVINQSSTSGVQVTSSTSSTTSTASVQGVKLLLSDNATTLVVGQTLNVNVSLFNSLPSMNTVATSKDWAFTGVPVALWPACYFGPAAYAVVLMGNYTLQDLRTVVNVTMGIGCMEGVTVDHAVFQPSSIQANLTGRYSVTNANQTLGPFRLTVNFTTSGYWNLVKDSKQGNTPLLSNPEFPQDQPNATPFVPGVYTVAVADEWGQAAILHFQVTPASGRQVDVVSVTGPVPPYNPGGPVVSITLKNTGDVPITSLNATLPLVNPRGVLFPYPFGFSVSPSNPLVPGQSIQETSTLIGASFDSSVEYPLTINGALLNGTQFSYTLQVQVVPPG